MRSVGGSNIFSFNAVINSEFCDLFSYLPVVLTATKIYIKKDIGLRLDPESSRLF